MTILNKFIAVLLSLLSMAVCLRGQDYPDHEVDSLLKAFKKCNSDSERIDVFFGLAQHNIFKPGDDKRDLDSAAGYIRKAALLNVTVKSDQAAGFQLLLESLIERAKRHEQEAKQLNEKAVALLANAANKMYVGIAWFSLSEYYDYSHPEEIGEKIRLVELARQAYMQAGNNERQAYMLVFLADLYNVKSERSKALEKLHAALDIYKTVHYSRLQAVYILYSNIYFTDGNYKQALNYGLMALKSAQGTGDSSMTLCQINNCIAIILVRLNELERAAGFYDNALEIAQNYNDNNAVLEIMYNAVANYIALKKPGEALAFMNKIPRKRVKPVAAESYIYTPLCYMVIYNSMKKHNEAEKYATEILHLIRIHQPADKVLHDFYRQMIGFYMASGQYAAAGKFMRSIDSISRKIGDPSLVKENYYLRFQLDTAQGRPAEAVNNLLQYQKLSDSLFNETTSRQLKQLEIEYETEKNKNEIKIKDQSIMVLAQQNQLQHSNLQRANLVRNFTIGGITLLCIILGLLYRQYRHKQHSSNLISQKNQELQRFLTEKEWLIKEIHHRVKNNFHVVASLLEIQSSYLKNKDALSAIKDSQHRIHSMSIIHQKLYQSENLSTIHMPEYIYELVEYLRDSYAIRDKIVFDLQIENIELNHAFAMTLGLILNEAITNSIKYAFTNTARGKIAISLSHMSDAQLLLRVADNGSGLPEGFNSHLGASMGMELLQGLTDDLGGTFKIDNNKGTCINIIFSNKPAASAAGPSFNS